MFKLLLRLFDWFIPQTIREHEKSEELDRARALICVLLVQLIYLAIPIVGYFASDLLRSFFTPVFLVALYLDFIASLIALILFRYFGNFGISSNLFAAGSYVAIIVAAFNVHNDVSFELALSISIALPFLVTQIANYASGLFWWIVVTVTPFLISQTNLHAVEAKWLLCWTIIMAGLFFSNYIGHYYKENLAQRLREERSHFEFAASHDALTGLANRVTFDRKLVSCLTDCRRFGFSAVLIYIDLDRFKPINDTFGHHVGDQVLIVVAQRLFNLVRRTDTVARLGGDEFAVIFERCHLNEVKHLIQQISEKISAPLEIENNSLSISCSIGIVTCPEDGSEPEELYITADRRMYKAKATDSLFNHA